MNRCQVTWWSQAENGRMKQKYMQPTHRKHTLIGIDLIVRRGQVELYSPLKSWLKGGSKWQRSIANKSRYRWVILDPYGEELQCQFFMRRFFYLLIKCSIPGELVLLIHGNCWDGDQLIPIIFILQNSCIQQSSSTETSPCIRHHGSVTHWSRSMDLMCSTH